MKYLGILALVVSLAVAGCGSAKAPASAPTQPKSSVVECPQDAPAGKSFNADTLVGQSLNEAEAAAKKYSCSVRVVERDGKPLAATMDFRPDRINVVVKDDKITDVQSVG